MRTQNGTPIPARVVKIEARNGRQRLGSEVERRRVLMNMTREEVAEIVSTTYGVEVETALIRSIEEGRNVELNLAAPVLKAVRIKRDSALSIMGIDQW